MKNENAWYIGQRAEALALVYLTRRSDLIVHQQRMDYGYDLLVEVLKNQRNTRRIFAVQARARTEPIKNARTLGIKYDEWKETSFPLCLFFFTMKNDQGFYTWIAEPIITSDNRPKLHLNTDGNLIELNNLALDSIVNQVNQWYDALFKELAA